MRTPLILVADDERDIVEIVCELLKEAGYLTVDANDGKQALKQVALHHPDGIVLDIKMPELDGLEVIRRLKSDALSQKIPVIVLTATQVIQESKEEFFRLGVFAVIAKPFEPDLLVDTVERAVPKGKKLTHAE